MNRFKTIIIAVAVLIGVAIVISAIHHFQLLAAENKFRAELQARGMVMDLSQALPPVTAAEQDGTGIFLKAAALLEADKTFLSTNSVYAMLPIAPGKAMVLSQQPFLEYLEGTTNSWEALAIAITQNQEALMLLRQILERPGLDFHIQYQLGTGAGFDFTNLNLVQLKKSARYLSEAAMLDLHDGDTASAVTNVRAMLMLADAVRNQRFMISELVRMTMVNMAQSLTWEILQATNITDADLISLQNDWGRVNFLLSYQDTLTMERISGDITVADWRKSDEGLKKYFKLEREAWDTMGVSSGDETVATEAREFFDMFEWRYWWSYPDEIRDLNGYAVLTDTAHQVATEGLFLKAYKQQQERLSDLGITNTGNFFGNLFSGKIDMHSMLSDSIATLQTAFHKVMLYDSASRVIITAIALKRFQLKHGSYPGKLHELVPEFLTILPLDAVDGQPLRYHRNADGTFLLYSVGEDGVDNGGDPSLPASVSGSSFYWQNREARDWVWPQPATPAEVQKYSADQAAKSK